jgi:integrase
MEDIERIANFYGERKLELRDLTIILVTYIACNRINETLSLGKEDIMKNDDVSFTLSIRNCKTEKFGKPIFKTIQNIFKSIDALDIINKYLIVYVKNIESSGKLFKLSARWFRFRLKKKLKELGFEGNYSIHSMRWGMAQELMRRNIDTQLIKNLGNWKSNVFDDYGSLESHKESILILNRLKEMPDQ